MSAECCHGDVFPLPHLGPLACTHLLGSRPHDEMFLSLLFCSLTTSLLHFPSSWQSWGARAVTSRSRHARGPRVLDARGPHVLGVPESWPHILGVPEDLVFQARRWASCYQHARGLRGVITEGICRSYTVTDVPQESVTLDRRKIVDIGNMEISHTQAG